MAKKKTRYPNRKSQLIKAAIISSSISIAVIIFSVIGVMLYNSSVSYIMTYGGEKISIGEFKLFTLNQKQMYEQYFQMTDIWEGGEYDFSETVKENALSSLVNSLIINDYAKRYNLSLTDEENAEVLENLNEYKANYFADKGKYPDVPDDRLVQIMSESILIDKLMLEVTPDYVFDEEDFETVYADFLENSKYDYLDIYISYVQVETAEQAANAKVKLEMGVDVADVIAEFGISEDEETSSEETEGEENGDETDTGNNGQEGTDETEDTEDNGYITLKDFYSKFYVTEDAIAAASKLPVGGISEVMEDQNTGNLLVVYVHEITEPDYDELRETTKENYIYNKRADVLDEKMTVWIEEAAIKYNQRAFDKIKVRDI